MEDQVEFNNRSHYHCRNYYVHHLWCLCMCMCETKKFQKSNDMNWYQL